LFIKNGRNLFGNLDNCKENYQYGLNISSSPNLQYICADNEELVLS
jgi:hypothetical protein